VFCWRLDKTNVLSLQYSNFGSVLLPFSPSTSRVVSELECRFLKRLGGSNGDSLEAMRVMLLSGKQVHGFRGVTSLAAAGVCKFGY